MLLNQKKKTIKCFECNKEYTLDPFVVFLDVLYEGSITCPKDHLIGNQSDEEWELFLQGD